MDKRLERMFAVLQDRGHFLDVQTEDIVVLAEGLKHISHGIPTQGDIFFDGLCRLHAKLLKRFDALGRPREAGKKRIRCLLVHRTLGSLG